MNQRAKDLAEQLRAFNDEVIAFIERCTEEEWRKVCLPEEWTVGVVARHIGAGHYSAVGMAKMIVNGEKLPELTMDQLTRMANDHARDHADCTKEEVLDLLRKEGKTLVDAVGALEDADLDRTGYLALVGKEMSARKLIEAVVLRSGGDHFAGMKTATSR